MVGLAATLIVLLLVAVIPVVAFGVAKGRYATQHLKRGTAIRGIGQGLVIAEQGGMHFDASSDWKNFLIENGYVPKEMFNNAAAVGGVMQYRIIWRPQTTKWIGTNFSWLCIYEDPASLRAGERVYLMVDNHVTSVQREVLLAGIQENLKQIGVELSEQELQELSNK